MALSDAIPSSPLAPGASLEESLKYYKTQYEFLESELADFQSSSKDLEAELEKDVEAAEKRERVLKEQASNLRYEADEWKEKHKQAKSEAAAAQAALEREIKDLRQDNLSLRQRVRDIEVANDDYERKQRTTEVSLEDMESKYNQTIERSIMLEEEVRIGEQERELLRIEAQRLKDEFSDFKIEAEITRKKLERAERDLAHTRSPLRIQSNQTSSSPRSELSPTTTDASGPSFDTPPAKRASSSVVSDTPTPPSPPVSERSAKASNLPATPSIAKPRYSINTTPRQSTISSRTNGHTRGASVATLNRAQPSSTYRQSLSKAGLSTQKPAGLPQSSSIIHLRNLRGKMQKLEERVQTARSKLPAPVFTPPKASPRSGSAMGNHIPSSVTVRSRRRNADSSVGVADALSDGQPNTPTLTRNKPSRQSLTQRPTSPIRQPMAAPPRPTSRMSGVSSRASQYQPGHSRPTSRASISGLRSLGAGVAVNFAPNASTDRVRPHSSLSHHDQYDGAYDESYENTLEDIPTATPRRTTFSKRTSDVGTAIPTPSPTKRSSIGGASKLPGHSRRQSTGFTRSNNIEEIRSSSRQSSVLGGVQEGQSYDLNETF